MTKIMSKQVDSMTTTSFTHPLTIGYTRDISALGILIGEALVMIYL